MDVNTHPDFVRTYADIKSRFGEDWAKRYVLVAPLITDDPHSALRRAFLKGLAAHAAAQPRLEAHWWATCERMLGDLAGSLVAEAEALLAPHS
ncbi:hypothetical protein [Cellulomonas marina]|uniref:Uncharacterized protein n=1 Tax=Cellulomonas marina TaxID=988821 RepID=A0A1I0WUW5_9CELL|nr:hypothetical protein [Cellulomonas marina]GIG30360.1 hypothetical protein Cma02nite_29600 [Cellulomonas marina]SFA92431.1 hypothetical protein SAMN05421867_103256 [Cellulomonas marina]